MIDTHTHPTEQLAATIEETTDRLDLISSILESARNKVRRQHAGTSPDHPSYRPIIAGLIEELDPVELEADAQLEGLIARMEETRTALAQRDWRSNLEPVEMERVNQHAPIIQALIAGADAEELANRVQEAAEAPDRTAAACWALLQPLIKARDFHPDRDTAKMHSALRTCEQRVTDQTTQRLTEQLASVRLQAEQTRNDLVVRRGDGRVGSTLQRYQFGGGRQDTPDPLDPDQVSRRVGSAT